MSCEQRLARGAQHARRIQSALLTVKMEEGDSYRSCLQKLDKCTANSQKETSLTMEDLNSANS